MFWGFGLMVSGLGFRVEGLGFSVYLDCTGGMDKGTGGQGAFVKDIFFL
jgi:hypothetical protein